MGGKPRPGDMMVTGEAARHLQGHVLGARLDGAGALWVGLDHDMYCTVHRGPMKLDFMLEWMTTEQAGQRWPFRSDR